jgi:hypothetical protein
MEHQVSDAALMAFLLNHTEVGKRIYDRALFFRWALRNMSIL